MVVQVLKVLSNFSRVKVGAERPKRPKGRKQKSKQQLSQLFLLSPHHRLSLPCGTGACTIDPALTSPSGCCDLDIHFISLNVVVFAFPLALALACNSIWKRRKTRTCPLVCPSFSPLSSILSVSPSSIDLAECASLIFNACLFISLPS